MELYPRALLLLTGCFSLSNRKISNRTPALKACITLESGILSLLKAPFLLSVVAFTVKSAFIQDWSGVWIHFQSQICLRKLPYSGSA
jgi:hypothetical protein